MGFLVAKSVEELVDLPLGNGDSAFLEQLSNLSRDLGIFNAGDFTGPRSHHAILFPSIVEEAFALTPLEAMVSGLPVIGTLTGGSKELFIHGVNSLCFKTSDPVDLADRVEALMDDPALSTCLAQEGRCLVSEKFTMQKIVREVEAYLFDVLKTSKKRQKTMVEVGREASPPPKFVYLEKPGK